MLNNKHLKQLRKTQVLIKHYKESIEKLNVPHLDSHKEIFEVYNALKPALYGNSLSVDEFLELSSASIEYIQKLGQYLWHITDYVNTIRLYERIIAGLQNEECNLKKKLGIE